MSLAFCKNSVNSRASAFILSAICFEVVLISLARSSTCNHCSVALSTRLAKASSEVIFSTELANSLASVKSVRA